MYEQDSGKTAVPAPDREQARLDSLWKSACPELLRAAQQALLLNSHEVHAFNWSHRHRSTHTTHSSRAAGRPSQSPPAGKALTRSPRPVQPRARLPRRVAELVHTSLEVHAFKFTPAMRRRLLALGALFVATHAALLGLLLGLFRRSVSAAVSQPDDNCADSSHGKQRQQTNAGCIACPSPDDTRYWRPIRRDRCSLPLNELVELVQADGGDAITVSGEGARMRISSQRDSRSCGGLELLREILLEHNSATASADDECELQRQLQHVASELGRSLSPAIGTAGEVAHNSGSFTLLRKRWLANP